MNRTEHNCYIIWNECEGVWDKWSPPPEGEWTEEFDQVLPVHARLHGALDPAGPHQLLLGSDCVVGISVARHSR